ncbi:MAG TPA: hypothetical protein VH641_00795 [Streptosporangiaceae bacterium]
MIPKLVTIRGEGGGVFQLSEPLPPRIAAAIEAGDIQVIEPPRPARRAKPAAKPSGDE